VRTARTSLPAAPDQLLAERDLAPASRGWRGLGVLRRPGHEEPADEDHEPAQVVLVQVPDLADQRSLERQDALPGAELFLGNSLPKDGLGLHPGPLDADPPAGVR